MADCWSGEASICGALVHPEGRLVLSYRNPSCQLPIESEQLIDEGEAIPIVNCYCRHDSGLGTGKKIQLAIIIPVATAHIDSTQISSSEREEASEHQYLAE